MPRDNVTRIDGARPRMKNPRGLANTRAATKPERLERALERLADSSLGEDEDGSYVAVKRPRRYRKRGSDKEPPKPRTGKRTRGQEIDWPGVVILAILASFCLAASVGVYTVLESVLEPLYGLVGGALRALIPLVVDMVCGHWAAEALARGRKAVALLLAAVILAAGLTDVDTAQIAPAIAERLHADHILDEAQSKPEQKPELEQKDESEGKHGKLQAEQNNSKILDLEQQKQNQSAEYTKKRLENNSKHEKGEGRIPIEYSLLGAFMAAAFLPLLERLLKKLNPR